MKFLKFFSGILLIHAICGFMGTYLFFILSQNMAGMFLSFWAPFSIVNSFFGAWECVTDEKI